MFPGQMAGWGIFFVFWFFMTFGFAIGWVVFLVAMWRGMKAQEEIAHHLKMLVLTQPGGQRP